MEIFFKCALPNGIHARPATTIKQFCAEFNTDLKIYNLRNGRSASLNSVLGIISADIACNDDCLIKLSGADCETTYKHLLPFIEETLPLCDEPLPEEPGEETVKLPRSLLAATPEYLSGQAVSRGIASGKPLLIGSMQLSKTILELDVESNSAEWDKLHHARSSLISNINQVLITQSDVEAEVLEAHLAIATDPELEEQLKLFLNDAPCSAALALKKTIDHFNQVLGKSTNTYLQERALDIQDVCTQLAHHIYGDSAITPIKALPHPAIIVAPALTPGEFIALKGDNLKGLVLESGGKTSHTIILARAAGIPTLVGVNNASQFCSFSKHLIIDANTGIVVRNPDNTVSRYYQLEQSRLARLRQQYEPYCHKAGQTADGHRIEIAANIACPEESDTVFQSGAEGIGLYRTEMLYMDRTVPPSEEEQLTAYRKVVEKAEGKPVIIRTFDVGGDKPIPCIPLNKEENPFLGYRAVRTYQAFAELFSTQLKALVRAAVYGPLRIMIPMVTCVEEMRWVRETLDKTYSELAAEGIETGAVELGMMLEVPSTVFAIEHLATYADFFSVGSNDLTQYFLACDRGNEQLSKLYHNYHPSFVRLLHTITSEAKKAGRWVGLCGEMGADKDLLPVLVGLGFDELSMAAPGIASCKSALASLDHKNCQQLVAELLKCPDVNAVQTAIEAFQEQSERRPVLEESLVILNGQANTKAEAIKILTDNLQLTGRTPDSHALEEAVWQREDIFTTGLGFGIAIPHCKSNTIHHNSISLLRLEKPVDWQAHDDQLVDTVFMLNIRESDTGDEHMKIFAKLARKIMHEDFRQKIKSEGDPMTLLAILKDELEIN